MVETKQDRFVAGKTGKKAIHKMYTRTRRIKDSNSIYDSILDMFMNFKKLDLVPENLVHCTRLYPFFFLSEWLHVYPNI